MDDQDINVLFVFVFFKQHKMMKTHIVLIYGTLIFSHHGCEVQEYIGPVYRSVRLLPSCGGGEWLFSVVINFQGR